MVKAEIDQSILQSMTERQLWDNLYKKGWRIKFGKDITVRPPGKDRGLKLHRNFGDEYSIASIRNRILTNTRPQRIIISPDKPPKHVKFIGKLHTTPKITGLRALYFFYLYKMGVFPKKRKLNPNRVYFLFREDIRFMQNIARETRLLAAHKIDTADQLTAHKDGLAAEMVSLSTTRKQLRYQTRRIQDEKKVSAIKADIADLSTQIGKLRKDVRLCEDIEKRSADMKHKLRKAAEDKKSNRRELKKHEPIR